MMPSTPFSFVPLALSLSLSLLPAVSAHAAPADSRPCVLAPTGVDSAPAPNAAASSDAATVCTLSAEDVAAREAITTPGIAPRAGLASPTRVPWVNANGWRFRRNPEKKFSYDLQAGRGPLAAAEAFVYGGDAALKIDPADAPEVNRMFAFFATLPPLSGLHDIADIGVIDDGSPITGEVMNLLERRNLLFAIVKKPSPHYAINIAIGSKQYPQAEAADPSGFALKIRHQLTDEKRSFRIYGSEVVIGRLTGDGHHVRLHLLNYSGRELQGLRIRLRGSYRVEKSYIFLARPANGAAPPADAGPDAKPMLTEVTDVATAHGATEFSMPALSTYAVIDLTPTATPAAHAAHAAAAHQ